MTLKEFNADDGHAVNDDTGDRFELLALDLVAPSLTNPRTTFNEARLAELAESIKASGVHQPILVRPLPGKRVEETSYEPLSPQAAWPLPTPSRRAVRPGYEIVAGERRYRASRLAGVATIPSLIRSLTDAQVLEIQLIENLQRDDLLELEEAEGYQRLCDETGIAKEAIGAKIGRSRSYVYARMKLLDLSHTAREGLRSGAIDASKALLIARIPDEKLQLKALEEASRRDYNGDPVSERQFKRWLQVNVMLKLADARFKIVDATLRPDAGACTDCGKRTGANPDLFADVDGPDVCTDPPCYHAKEVAHSTRLVEQARARGMNVIEGKEALELKPQHYNPIKGYTALDDEIRSGLSERELKSKVTMFVDPHDQEAIEVVPDELARKAYQKINPLPAGGSAKQQEKFKAAREVADREQLERDYQTRWRTRAIAIIQPRVEAGEVDAIPAPLLRRMILELSGADQRCDDRAAAESLGLESYDEDAIASAVRTTDGSALVGVVVMVLLRGDRVAQWNWNKGEREVDGSAPTIEALSSQLCIDLDAIKAEVQAEIRAEREPEAPPTTELAAPQGKVGKGENSTKPAAPARVPKTTKEEASKSIAAALQELDPEPEKRPLSDVAAWPFPTELKAGQLNIGSRVKVVATGLYEGKEGKVRASVAASTWQIDFTGAKIGRLPKWVNFLSSELEVVS